MTRDYGFRGHEAIIDHPVHGRLLLCDGFGGVDSLDGGCVRWRHGSACRLLPDDTLASLDEERHNDEYSALHALVKGYGSRGRQMLEWSGDDVARLAESVGL